MLIIPVKPSSCEHCPILMLAERVSTFPEREQGTNKLNKNKITLSKSID